MHFTILSMIYERDTGKNLIDTYGFYGALSFVHYFYFYHSNSCYDYDVSKTGRWHRKNRQGQELVLKSGQ